MNKITSSEGFFSDIIIKGPGIARDFLEEPDWVRCCTIIHSMINAACNPAMFLMDYHNAIH